jgi:hypothetical protein
MFENFSLGVGFFLFRKKSVEKFDKFLDIEYNKG